jgi:hypothetical protein
VIAVDWSGAKVGSERRIWLAEMVDGSVVRLESGRTRAEVIEEVVAVRKRCSAIGETLTVGLDFSFGFPGWFANDLGCNDGPSLWAVVASRGERWLSACETPFWGRPGRPNPHRASEGFRATELALRREPLRRLQPKSTFQIGGAGSVGTGSIRGMPHLLTLVDSGFKIWPFDEAGVMTVVEIYPRLFTGPLVKSDSEARRCHLMGIIGLAEVDDAIADDAVGSDDAFDALVSAHGMFADLSGGNALVEPTKLSRLSGIEGWIWKTQGSVG